MKPFVKILLAATVGLTGQASAAFAGTDKLARIMGFGGVCSDCDLSKKNLSGAKLNGASFPRTNFTGTDLSGAELTGSNFSRAVFRRADLSDVEVNGSNFSWADFSGATLDGMSGHGINLSHAILNGAKGPDAEFEASNFSHSKMLGASFQDAEFNVCNLSHSDMTGAKLNETEFTNSNLSHTQLGAASFREASFERVDFRNADFGSAILKNADFNEVYLAGADLSHVRGLRNEQLQGACGDDKTKLPRKLTTPACDDTDWADQFTGRNGSQSYSFSIDLDDEELAEIQREFKNALAGGRTAMAEAGRALADAFEEADREGFHFDWDTDKKSKQSWQVKRVERSLGRVIRLLGDLELNSDKAQDKIDKAIANLEQAREIQQNALEEQELAGGG